VLLGLSCALRFIVTPTTMIAAWICTILALAVAGKMLINRNRVHGAALGLLSILLPVAISVWFWKQVEREMDAGVKAFEQEVDSGLQAMESELRSLDRALNRSMKGLQPSLVNTGPQHVAPRPPPLFALPTSRPHWDAAKQQIRVGGTGRSDGRTYVLVDGRVTYDGAEVLQPYRGYLYKWTVSVQDRDVVLIPKNVRPL
jgi:hypothetical protein